MESNYLSDFEREAFVDLAIKAEKEKYEIAKAGISLNSMS
jgi:hypothetical protein